MIIIYIVYNWFLTSLFNVFIFNLFSLQFLYPYYHYYYIFIILVLIYLFVFID